MVGVTLMQKFVTAGSSTFEAYIEYLDRESAKQKNVYKDYNLFTEEMKNSSECTDLFTAYSDKLTENEKSNLKEAFMNARDADSLMWQTVISFDNRWLEQNGLFDQKTGNLNINKMQEFTRVSMDKMLTKENLNNAVWSAGIHYDTDNLHVHIATVELMPTRDRGKFKLQSIESAKSAFVNNVMSQSLENQKINNIIRKEIIEKSRTEIDINQNQDIHHSMCCLRNMLPEDRRLWKYNNNAMKKYRGMIDSISKTIISSYFENDYNELCTLLEIQQKKYEMAYGGEKNNYADDKLQDLYARLGNSILKICKTFDRTASIRPDLPPSPSVKTDAFSAHPDKHNKFYYKNKKSKKVQEALNLIKKKKLKDACKILDAESMGGNVCASEKLADIYAQNKNVVPNEKALAEETYLFALKGYHELADSLPEESSGFLSFLNYKIGSYYFKGKGVKKNYELAAKHFIRSEDNPYSQYNLGKMYEEGLGVEKDTKKSFEYFKMSADNSCNAYASYEVAQRYAYGIDVDKDRAAADYYYKLAMSILLSAEKQDPSRYTELKLGQMFAKGLGHEKDIPKAIDMLKKALDAGERNAYFPLAKIYLDEPGWGQPDVAVKYLEQAVMNGNKYAKYTLANVYLNKDLDYYNPDSGINLLKDVASKGMVSAQYKLGNIYYNNAESNPYYDKPKAVYWYTEAAKNHNAFAQYRLGKIYLSDQNEGEAEKWLLKAANKNNEFAQHTLGKLYLNSPALKDYKKADIWLNQAAANGNMYSMMQLGYMYLKNDNLDYKKATAYFKQAQEAGHPDAGLALTKLRDPKRTSCKRKLTRPKASIAALKNLFRENIESAKNQAAYARLQEEIERN